MKLCLLSSAFSTQTLKIFENVECLAELCFQYADNISVCWIIFENVKDYLLDSAFSNQALKMLKTIEMFKDVC